MEDLARIVAVMFGAWIASGIALVGFAWLAPVSLRRALRLTLMLVAAAGFVFLTGVLFGVKIGVAAALPASLIAFAGCKRD